MTIVCPLPVAATEPSFARAIDRELVQQLARDLLGDGSRNVSLAPDYVRWKGKDGCIVGWHALVGDEQAPSYITVRTAPPLRLSDEASKLRHRADEETDEWQRSLALSEEHGLLLIGFPLDRQMPDLRRLVRASKVRTLVQGVRPDLVPDSLRISKSKSRRSIVRYKPERRAVLRWDLGFKSEDAQVADCVQTIWFRLLAEPLPFRAPLAAAARDAGIRVPELLASPHERLLLEGHLDGSPFDLGDRSRLDDVAATLRRLHGAKLPEGAPVRDAGGELELVLRAGEDMGLLTRRSLAPSRPACRQRALLDCCTATSTAGKCCSALTQAFATSIAHAQAPSGWTSRRSTRMRSRRTSTAELRSPTHSSRPTRRPARCRLLAKSHGGTQQRSCAWPRRRSDPCKPIGHKRASAC